MSEDERELSILVPLPPGVTGLPCPREPCPAYMEPSVVHMAEVIVRSVVRSLHSAHAALAEQQLVFAAHNIETARLRVLGGCHPFEGWVPPEVFEILDIWVHDYETRLYCEETRMRDAAGKWRHHVTANSPGNDIDDARWLSHGAPSMSSALDKIEKLEQELRVYTLFGTTKTPKKEAINHPAHYGGDIKYEAIKVIDDWDLGFSPGNALKYIIRAPHKGTQLEDLNKALWYLVHQPRPVLHSMSAAEVADFWQLSAPCASALLALNSGEQTLAALEIQNEILRLTKGKH